MNINHSFYFSINFGNVGSHLHQLNIFRIKSCFLIYKYTSWILGLKHTWKFMWGQLMRKMMSKALHIWLNMLHFLEVRSVRNFLGQGPGLMLIQISIIQCFTSIHQLVPRSVQYLSYGSLFRQWTIEATYFPFVLQYNFLLLFLVLIVDILFLILDRAKKEKKRKKLFTITTCIHLKHFLGVTEYN